MKMSTYDETRGLRVGLKLNENTVLLLGVPVAVHWYSLSREEKLVQQYFFCKSKVHVRTIYKHCYTYIYIYAGLIFLRFVDNKKNIE